MRAVSIGLAVGGLLLLASSSAQAQVTQIKPRVLLMVDTSGSMNFHLFDGNSTGGDGSDLYSSPATFVGAGATMLRSQAATPGYSLYEGFETGAKVCAPQVGPFDGVNSRLFNAKSAISDVINGSGDIDWGLMRYNGTYCNFSTTFSVTVCKNGVACKGSATCSSNNNTNGFCQCANDDQCGNGEFCLAGRCGTDGNLCNVNSNLYTGMTDTRNNQACANHAGDGSSAANGAIPQTYAGGCGSNAGAGSAACATPHSCQTNADCGAGGNCVAAPGLGGIKWCACGTQTGTCNAPWSTCGANNWCLYANNCVGATGGVVLIDPNTAGFSSNQVLPWINNAEIYSDKGGAGSIDSRISDPELHANGGTPLAGAARAATQWYINIRDGLAGEAADPKIACRPYVLVQLTDGEDSCEGSASNDTNGPIAAAAGFVGATAPNAKNPNKVYVIGLATTAADVTELNTIAQAGGTGAARFATSKQDIEAALADIVASSVLVEKCNAIDDNCNGQCDENFPGVAVTNPAPDGSSCSNPHPAATCDNGQLGQCLAKGVFVCSADQLSQVCSTPVCTTHAGATITNPAGSTMRLSGTTGGAVVGQVLFVSGSNKVANNGAFLVTATGANTIDVSNAGVVVPDASTVDYAVPPTQGAATTSVAAAGNVTLTVPAGTTSGVPVGATIFILGATNAANNGSFTVSAVTNTTITYGNAAGVSGDLTIKWAVNICKGIETCNGLDDDCDGIVDNCGGSTPGSCCTSNCPACAKAPFIETCNNCDDDCDGVIDDHLVDTGLSCGNNTGDCLNGTTVCCNMGSNPNGTPPTCVLDGVTDQIMCKGGNPPYPTPGADKCDGTDDNCNGTANDGPPQQCFTDGTNTLPMGKDGHGVCHHGLAACTAKPFCGTSGVVPPNCIVGPCPAGWPANKTCPNLPSTYDPTCPGLVAPSTEFCDGLDNDCNDCKDDNPQDAWINTECCASPGGALTDCDNTMTGSRCKRGHWQCFQAGGACTAGAKTCVGSVFKTTETCNMIDDDCNGAVDDVPGVGAPCTGPGIVTGGECTAFIECSPSGPICKQKVGPSPEKCNGKDDDCDGQIDNPPFVPNPPDPVIGTACQVPMAPADKPPCKAGDWECIAGMPVCVGAVGPMPNQCNGISTDCTGNPNTNGNCPTGFQCYQGNCVAPCDATEFPCPGGYACNKNTNQCDMNGVHTGCCVPDACANLTCPPGFNCQLDAQGNASCVDPCLTVTCPPSYVCKAGACVDGSCRTQGCPDGQVCVSDGMTSFVCQDDPCANVMCDSNQFCKGGVCVNSCSGPCPNGQYCSNGQCVPDPCGHTPCVEGQVCQVQNGVGVCVENQCQFGCNIGQACCGGECVADQCELLHCPEDTHCKLAPDCQATCETNPASPKDQIVGAGGGGFGCAVSGSASDSSSLAWLIVVAGALLLRRRRAAEVRK